MVVCFVLTFNACDRNNLVRVTAKDVLDVAKFEKGKRAVLINVWATSVSYTHLTLPTTPYV